MQWACRVSLFDPRWGCRASPRNLALSAERVYGVSVAHTCLNNLGAHWTRRDVEGEDKWLIRLLRDGGGARLLLDLPLYYGSWQLFGWGKNSSLDWPPTASPQLVFG